MRLSKTRRKYFILFWIWVVILMYLFLLKDHQSADTSAITPVKVTLEKYYSVSDSMVTGTRSTSDTTHVDTFTPSVTKINEYKYTFLCNPVKRCPSANSEMTERIGDVKSKTADTKPILLLMIKSAPGNRERRDVIRRTWGSETNNYNEGIDIRTVFTIGLPINNSGVHIHYEFIMHEDILQVNFIDTYFNNTLKTISNINWVSRHCRRARYIVLLDDDFFVNPINLIKMLENLPTDSKMGLYMGKLFEGYEPHRDPKSKWFVSKSEYPYTNYPPFISAGTVILSLDVVLHLQTAMEHMRPYRLDDIYLAIVAQQLKIKPKRQPYVYGYKILPKHKFFKTLITAHGYGTQDVEKSWKEVYRSPVIN